MGALATAEAPSAGSNRLAAVAPGRRRRGWPVQAYLAVLVVVYVLAAGGAALYWRAHALDSARANAAADAGAAATLAASQLTQGIDQLRQAIVQLSASPALSATGCDLSSLQAAGGRLLVVSPAGTVICASDHRTTSDPVYARQPWFAQALRGAVLAGPITDPQTGAPMIVVGGPARQRGAIVELVDLRTLGTSLEKTLGGRRHLEFVVVDPTGRRIITTSTDPARFAGVPLAATGFARSADPDRRPDIEGKPWVHAQAVVAGLDWTVYAGAAMPAALSTANALFVDQLEAILGGLVVFLVAAAVISSRITRPIRRLSRAVELAGSQDGAGPGYGTGPGYRAGGTTTPDASGDEVSGRLPVIEIGGPREIAALSDSFNRATQSVRQELRARHNAEAEARSRAAQLAVELEHSRSVEQALRATQAEVRALNTELDERVRDRTAELEAANQELEAFAYAVSHDLRAPLRAVHGFSIALEEDCADALDGPGREHLRRIRAAAVRMGELIDDLLQLSRVTRTPMARDRVDLSALAREVTDHLRAAEPERSIRLSIADDVTARGDGHLLRIALENLLHNAWKFTRRQADPSIEFGAAITADSTTVYYVADNGVGFDARYASKLFKPFQRLHSVDEFEGTGIGLATVARIIKRHGGRIWAESEVGSGTRISFTCEPTSAVRP